MIISPVMMKASHFRPPREVVDTPPPTPPPPPMLHSIETAAALGGNTVSDICLWFNFNRNRVCLFLVNLERFNPSFIQENSMKDCRFATRYEFAVPLTVYAAATPKRPKYAVAPSRHKEDAAPSRVQRGQSSTATPWVDSHFLSKFKSPFLVGFAIF